MADYLAVWISLAFFMSAMNIPCIDGRNAWKTEKKDEASEHLVTNLPGQPKVDFNQYAGYVTVNEEHGRALFYWFYEAASMKEEKPLVLWLNGGPGCSSVGYGATEEIGPFLVDGNGTGLIFNKYSWNQEANLLFIDSPVGVGFSYSNTSADYNTIGDNITAIDTYMFLRNWFKRFPQYRRHDFYIAGESYGGKYVPELAELIYDMNNSSYNSQTYINLKGFMVGNPETHDGYDWEGFVDYAWSHAIVSDETHRIIKENCNFSSDDTWGNQNCTEKVNEILKQYKQIDMYSLYTPTCIEKSSIPANKSETEKFKYSTTKPRKMLAGYDPCLDDHGKVYYNRYDVQRALHVTKDLQLKNWSICNYDIFNNWKDGRFSVLPIYKKLIAAGLRIWVYSGDTDGRVPVLSTRYSLNALGLPTIGSWHPWYHNEQVSGWIQEYEGLTFATFKGAGHAVPLFKPSNALAFFRSYLSGTALPEERQMRV